VNVVYAFTEAEKTTHSVALLCRILGVARSSFYAWLAARPAAAARQADEDALAAQIPRIHTGSRGAYGVPRVHAALRRQGLVVNRKKVERVMTEAGIRGITRRKRRGLTRPDKKTAPAPDLVGRDFTAGRPAQSSPATSRFDRHFKAGGTSPRSSISRRGR
jgi:putative transposase